MGPIPMNINQTQIYRDEHLSLDFDRQFVSLDSQRLTLTRKEYELLALLTRARAVLDRYMFEAEGEVIRDDVAEVCMAIDDALPDPARVLVKQAQLERDPQRSAA